MTTAPKPILLAAGGTGGHVLPALALTTELIARGHAVHFVTDTRGLRFVTERPGMTVHVIRAGTIRKQPVRLIKDLANMVIGVLQSFDIIRDHNPGAVVGFGGYPSFPPVFCAQILRIPTLLHSADAVVGQANRMLARFCTRLALSFPNFKGLDDKLRAKTIVTGLPIRAEIEALYNTRYTAPDQNAPFHLTIMGGSQGSSTLGPKVAQILTALPDTDRARLTLTHQVRTEDLDTVKATYAAADITANCAPFFTDIPGILANTHLFIGRSGASTVMEMAITSRPAIFVPLIASTHKDAQQRENARVLQGAGAAIIIEEAELNATNLLAHLGDLMHNPGKLSQMAAAATTMARPHAAKALADAVLELAIPPQ